jgi:hypothetical protein
MQAYCGYMKLKGALFFVINKNTDDLYIEYVPFKQSRLEALVGKAGEIVSASEPPPRMRGASASFFECKWCPAFDVCFKGAESQKLCRTCRFASPAADGKWDCSKGKAYGEVCEEYQDIAK